MSDWWVVGFKNFVRQQIVQRIMNYKANLGNWPAFENVNHNEATFMPQNIKN